MKKFLVFLFRLLLTAIIAAVCFLLSSTNGFFGLLGAIVVIAGLVWCFKL